MAGLVSGAHVPGGRSWDMKDMKTSMAMLMLGHSGV